MKHIVIKLMILFLYYQFSFAQFGEVIYKNIPTLPDGLEEMKKTNPDKYKRYSFMINKMNEQTKRLRYTLKFNRIGSFFTANQTMAKEDNIMMGSSIQESDYYYYLKNNERYQKNSISGKEILINKTPLQWVITKENKNIKGYNCRKAEAIQIFYSIDSRTDKVRRKEQPVVAWFTTELPFSFGPENYGGLPGLVLELKTQGKNYKVDNIKLEKNKKNYINFPITNKAISEQEAAMQIHNAITNMIGG